MSIRSQALFGHGLDLASVLGLVLPEVVWDVPLSERLLHAGECAEAGVILGRLELDEAWCLSVARDGGEQ